LGFENILFIHIVLFLPIERKYSKGQKDGDIVIKENDGKLSEVRV
jgi:hypothetical protein